MPRLLFIGRAPRNRTARATEALVKIQRDADRASRVADASLARRVEIDRRSAVVAALVAETQRLTAECRADPTPERVAAMLAASARMQAAR